MTTNQQYSPAVERALERVRKMLALANDAAATEGERDNAMRMALNTLAKHNLTMAAAEARGEKPQEERGMAVHAVRNYPWVTRTVDAIARLYFCNLILAGDNASKSKKKVYIIGRAGNVATTVELMQFVISSIDREATKASKGQYSPGAYWRNFCKGASIRVHQRCVALRAEAEKQTQAVDIPSTGTSLVLANHYANERAANEALIAQTFGKLKDGVNRERRAGDGYGEGRAYGDRVSLNRQLNGGSNNPRLK